MTDEARREEEPLPLWAARVPNVREDGQRDTRLVVVEARSAEDAQHRTALIDVEFRPATEADEDEWYDRTDKDLNDRDISQLLGFVRRAQRELLRRRLKDGGRHRPEHEQTVRFKARKLAELAGKLEAMGGEPDDDDAALGARLREVS